MITPWQLSRRHLRMQGSDTPSLFGANPWKTLTDVYYEKLRLVAPEAASKAMEAGSYGERGIADWAETIFGPLRRSQFRVYHDPRDEPGRPYIPLAMNLDAIVRADGYPWEFKKVSQYPAKDWGEPGTDQVTPYVYVQAHTAMIVTGKPLCHVAAELGDGRWLCMYPVPYDEEFGEELKRRVRSFWYGNVVPKILPNEPVSIGIAGRLHREPDTRADVQPDLVTAWQRAIKRRSRAEKLRMGRRDAVITALGRAECTQEFRDGELAGTEATFFENDKGTRQLRLRKVGR